MKNKLFLLVFMFSMFLGFDCLAGGKVPFNPSLWGLKLDPAIGDRKTEFNDDFSFRCNPFSCFRSLIIGLKKVLNEPPLDGTQPLRKGK